MMGEAEALYASLRREAEPGIRGFPDWRSLPTGQRILNESSPDVQLAVLEIACGEFLAGAVGPHDQSWRQPLARDVILTLLKRKVAAPPDRASVIVDFCASLGTDHSPWFPMLALLRLVSKPPTPREVEALGRLRASLAHKQSSKTRKIVERIDDILSGDSRPLMPGGTWSARVLADIADDARRDAWCELVTHLLTASDAEPAKKWEAQLPAYLDAVGRSRFLSRAIEWLDLGPMPGTPTTPQVPERDANYLKGFVWALSAFNEPDVARALADLAGQCLKKIPNHGAVSSRVGNACIRVLARLPGTGPVAQLGRLRLRVKYAIALQLVDKAMTEAAERAGITPEELEEIATPTFDLDQYGSSKHELGEYVAEIRITGSLDVALSWITADGKPLKSVPAAVREHHAEALNQLKKTVKEIAEILPAQKARLEHLVESDRLIPFDQWRPRYLEHPLVGEMARRLIWKFSEGERAGLGALRNGRIVDIHDRPIEWLSTATAVNLWHPLGSPHALVLSWRSWLDRNAVIQPFKQAHREVYVLTEAERATGTHSNRFANHVLQQHQFAALCRERGWRYTLQGDWDSANTPMRRLARWNIDVALSVDAPADRTRLADSGVFRVIRIDQVGFYRDGVQMRLTDVPGVAFSEAMRDVDLFVAVCSIGNNPDWRGRSVEGHREYWQDYSVGELSEPAKTRRGVLELLIPRLKLAERLSLEERFLVVRGDLATYKIHLGSGSVRIEPGSRYLPIVLAPARKQASVRNAAIPFEGDSGLSDILIKALMLAEDRKIADPLIVSLIRPS